MKIRFLSNTHIRIRPDLSLAPVGMIFKDTELEVSSQIVNGQEIRGNDKWYLDSGGIWYYWSGRTKVVEGPISNEPETTSESNPVTVPWASNIDYPIFKEMDLISEQGEIPKDETRRVPPFETLEMIEAGFQNMLAKSTNLPLSTVRNETLNKEQDASVQVSFDSQEAQDLENSSQAAKEPLPDRPEHKESVIKAVKGKEITPDSQGGHSAELVDQNRTTYVGQNNQVNWGVEMYNIEHDWWDAQRLTGKGVRIALLSTGIMPDHPDLENVVDWGTFVNATQIDEDGIGNQAAVICAGKGNLVHGVAKDAELLIGKIGSQNRLIRPDEATAGLEWAIEGGANIIAVLVDFPRLDNTATRMKALVELAEEKDILLLAPVGNSERDTPEIRYPAGMDGVISIGAHDKSGKRCWFSAKSYQLDLLAPGQDLLTSDQNTNVVRNVDSVAIATAFTAGFAGLIWQWLKQRNISGRAAYIESLLKQTARSRKNLNMVKDINYGYGLLNPPAALKKLINDNL